MKIIYIALLLGLLLTFLISIVPIFPEGSFYEIYTLSILVIYLILKEQD